MPNYLLVLMIEGYIFTWSLDPVIIWINDSFPLKYYGLLFAAGILLAYHLLKRIFLQENERTEHLDNLFTYIFLGTIIGARLGHCFFYEFNYYLNHPIEILLPIRQVNNQYIFTGFQGLASHGGAIGVFIGIILYCKKHQRNLFWLLNRLAIVIPISAAFIRFGNFMNSEIIGKATYHSWGIIFSRVDNIPRHPTQLYEAFGYLMISLTLYLFYLKFKSLKSILFSLFLIMLFSLRFFVEFLKENQVSFEQNLVLNMGQILSLPFILLGIIISFYQLKNPTKR